MPHLSHHQLAAVSLLQLVLALRFVVTCPRAPPAAAAYWSDASDVVSYSFPALDDRAAHGLVVATSSPILSPAAFLFDAQLFPTFNRTEGFVLLSRPVQLWGTDAGTTKLTREACFNTTFTVHGVSTVAFVLLLDSFPPLASPAGLLRGTNNSSTFSGGVTLNASDSLATVEVGAVGSYGPESPDVGLNVTVKLNAAASRSSTVWIEYNAVAHHLRVYVAAAGEPRRPLKALLEASINLTSRGTTQNAFVGFFAATVRDVIHGVRNWELVVDTFPGGDGDGDNGGMPTSWLLILLAVLGSVAATAGVVSVAVCYCLWRRRQAELRMEHIMKQSYPHHPTSRGVGSVAHS